MFMRNKIITAALAAVFALSLMAGTASALRSLSITGSTTLTLNGRLTFESGGNLEIICDFTFTKTISRIIPKIDEILIGKVTRVDTPTPKPRENCRASSGTLEAITILGLEREEEGRIYYKGIRGTLPRLSFLQWLWKHIKAAFTAEVLFVRQTCLYEPERPVPVLASVDASGVIGNLRIEPVRATRISGGGFCPPTGTLKGELIPLQRTTVVLI
jgi:hypothetical protein